MNLYVTLNELYDIGSDFISYMMTCDDKMFDC